MRGTLYSVSYDGKSVDAVSRHQRSRSGRRRRPVAGNASAASRASRSIRSSRSAARRGFGKFYTYTDTSEHDAAARLQARAAPNARTTRCCSSGRRRIRRPRRYDGGRPRELFRLAQPFANHNGGHIAFNPLASAGDADFGLLYIGFADGGSGGDPLSLAQNLGSAFGKILRIDPLGTNSANGKYGIPAGEPVRQRRNAEALGEIYAYGVRNPQRFSWDPKNGNMFVADIGQNIVEEISPVTAGANLGWNVWEGSFGTSAARRQHRESARRSEDDLSDRRVRPDRSAASSRSSAATAASSSIAQRHDSAAAEPADLRRQPERRDLLRQRRQAARRADRTPSAASCSTTRARRRRCSS